MIFEPHQGTTARLFGGLFLCQFLAVACFSGLSKIAYFRLILESGIKRETVRNFSPRYIHWLMNDGTIMRSACGSTIMRSVCQRVSPRESPACHWPGPIAAMPAFTAWAR